MTALLVSLLLISLGFTIYAVWRWRPRAYLVRGPIEPPQPWPDPAPSAEQACRNVDAINRILLEPCLSCGRSKPPDAACPHCGFCGIVFATDPPPRGRLVSEGKPARANEAKDSSRREAAS